MRNDELADLIRNLLFIIRQNRCMRHWNSHWVAEKGNNCKPVCDGPNYCGFCKCSHITQGWVSGFKRFGSGKDDHCKNQCTQCDSTHCP